MALSLFKLFDYNNFIEELKENEKKKEVVEKYTKYYGSQDNVDIYNTQFYKDYLSKFEIPFNLAIPEDLEAEFDWDLLIRLVAGSFSSNYDLDIDEKSQSIPIVHLFITVKRGNESVTKDITELWSFQVLRLFEIYVEEQMNLFSLMKEVEDNEDDEYNEGEEEAILAEQKICLAKYKQKVALLMKQFVLNKELEDLL